MGCQRVGGGKCVVAGCGEPTRSRGLCQLHYNRWIKYGKTGVGPSTRLHQRARGRVCSVPQCDRPVRCKGLCSVHYGHGIRSSTCARCGGRKTAAAALCAGCFEKTFEPPAAEKRCTGCNAVQPVEAFGWRSDGSGRSKLRSKCRTCERARARTYMAALRLDPDRWRRVKAREKAARDLVAQRDPERWLFRSLRVSAKALGIDPELVFERLQRTGHRCEVCGLQGAPSPGRRLHIDHCHTTGRFRGLLCSPCNRALGLVEDDTDRVLKLAKYLKGA